MADYLASIQSYLGGATKSAVSAGSSASDDFADFESAAHATAPAPLPPSHSAPPAASATGPAGAVTGLASFAAAPNTAGRPYTKWYRVWERVTLADFYQELVIIPIFFVIVLVNLWGSRANRRRAKGWAARHLPMLESEFSSIGFGGKGTSPKLDHVQSSGLAKAMAGSTDVPPEMLREKSKSEYLTYCTGRANIAWLDIKITLYPRYNPLKWLGEIMLSFFFDSMPAPVERIECTAYCFDGMEKALVPAQSQSGIAGAGNKDSCYDGFVWAVVHKNKMKQLRDDRYDLCLTTTKDHPKLPIWATVMSESAEVTEVMLTPDLIKAITDAGEDLEALIVSDQPIDAPKKLNDTVPKKRVSLSMLLNPSPASTSLFATFLRLPDQLVNTAHFRPEAMRKIRATREEEQRKIRKQDEEGKAEDRSVQRDKLRKEERDRKLSKLSADEQKKFLERERKNEQRKGMKKKTMRA